MKIKLAALVALATAHYGYAGPAEAEKVRAHLISAGASVNDPDGKPIDLAKLEIEAQTATKTHTFSAADFAAASGTTTTVADAAKELPADIEIVVQAKVDAALKAAGVTKGADGRPQLLQPDKIGAVKSGNERMYENAIKSGAARFEDYNQARGFQLWLSEFMCLRAQRPEEAARKKAEYVKWAEHNGLANKAYSTTSSTGGGALVPEHFEPDLIRNVLQYGVARKLAKVIQMPEQQVILPRRTGGLTGYYPLENAAITTSNATYDNVALNAKTFAVLCQASYQILQDSGLPIADLVMEEIAYTIANQEDLNLLVGDASGTYCGITGFENKYGVTATDGGYVVVGGVDATAHTIAQVAAAIARVPQYARANMKITCSPTISATIFNRLAVSTGVGGLTMKEITGMGIVNFWQGIPIIENNVMSSVTDAAVTARTGFTAGDQVDFLIGDFSRAALFGERLGLELAMSTERGFDAYSVYFRGVVRHDMVVHSVGTSTAAGPVVSFWQT